MADITALFADPASERARRDYLGRVEAALRERGAADLAWSYQPPRKHPADPTPASATRHYSELVVTAPGVEGEARVTAVSVVQHFVGTAPGSDGATPVGSIEPALEGLRARVRAFGILGMRAEERRYDPFPGAGRSEYELTIYGPAPAGHARDGEVDFPLPVAQHHTSDPAEVATLLHDWRETLTRQVPSAPLGDAHLKPLRAVARARRDARATLDWGRVEALRSAGRFVEAWYAAGLAADFDPDRPATWQPDTPARLAPTQPASFTDIANYVVARLTAGGLQALADPRVMREAIATRLEGLPEPSVPPSPPPAAPPIDRDALADAVAHLSPGHLLWHYPRDERGRLPLKQQVLLAPVGPAPAHPQGRQVWLTAASPDKRRDPQEITLRLLPLIAENQSHRWDEARWLWDDRAGAATEEQRWGVGGLPLATLGFGAWRSGLAGPSDPTTASPAERAARCILLQDAGRLEEALALYDIDPSDEVARLLAGAMHDYHHRQHAAAWENTARELVRSAALWRFGPLIRTAVEAKERWVAEKRGRKWQAPSLRLLWLPHQQQQSKDAIMLTSRDRRDTRPRLALESSASNTRLPLVAWQRPPEIDLLRFGLLAREELP